MADHTPTANEHQSPTQPHAQQAQIGQPHQPPYGAPQTGHGPHGPGLAAYNQAYGYGPYQQPGQQPGQWPQDGAVYGPQPHAPHVYYPSQQHQWSGQQQPSGPHPAQSPEPTIAQAPSAAPPIDAAPKSQRKPSRLLPVAMAAIGFIAGRKRAKPTGAKPAEAKPQPSLAQSHEGHAPQQSQYAYAPLPRQPQPGQPAPVAAPLSNSDSAPNQSRIYDRFRWRRKSSWRFAIRAVGAVVATVAVLFGGTLAYHSLTKPNPFLGAANKRAPVIQILARDGSLIAERGRPHDYIPLTLLPLHVTGAVIATEDRRFYNHWGIDPAGLTRALFANLRAGRYAQGGSTITQQLAKNLFLSHARTISRKSNEIVLALWLEMTLTKRQILELYLNQVYFGSGAYGIEAAAQKYFGKSARALKVREAAVIAGLLQAPSRYSPFRNPTLARKRGDAVLSKMRDAGIIDETTLKRARSTRLAYAEPNDKSSGDKGVGYAIDYVLERMPSVSGVDDGVIIVETTIDARLQKHAQAVVADVLKSNRRRIPAAQGAAVIIDGEGELRAIVGGRSHSASQFNRAIKAQRQPGSAFKPFVYLAALDHGMEPNTTVYDLPISIGDWSPRNANGSFSGAMSLTDGLAKSVNTIAVRLQQQIGVADIVTTARKLGITSKLRTNPTLALGTSEVAPLELTTAYATLANGGLRIEPHAIRRIRTHSGRLIYARTTNVDRQVVDGRRVGQLNTMLKEAVRRGTGKRASISGYDIAGKTGTTQDGRDAWFVGYTRQLTGGVWIGHDRDGGRTTPISGGQLPAIVWRRIMERAHRGLAPMPLAWTDGPARRLPKQRRATARAPRKREIASRKPSSTLRKIVKNATVPAVNPARKSAPRRVATTRAVPALPSRKPRTVSLANARKARAAKRIAARIKREQQRLRKRQRIAQRRASESKRRGARAPSRATREAEAIRQAKIAAERRRAEARARGRAIAERGRRRAEATRTTQRRDIGRSSIARSGQSRATRSARGRTNVAPERGRRASASAGNTPRLINPGAAQTERQLDADFIRRALAATDLDARRRVLALERAREIERKRRIRERERATQQRQFAEQDRERLSRESWPRQFGERRSSQPPRRMTLGGPRRPIDGPDW